MSHVESHIQIGCVNWFRYAYPEYAPLLFSVPNGGLRGKTEAAIMKAEGIVAGVSDLILLTPSIDGHYHALCVEVKKETFDYGRSGKLTVTRGRQSKEQKVWQRAVESRGNRYAVIYNIDEFQKIITEHLGPAHAKTCKIQDAR